MLYKVGDIRNGSEVLPVLERKTIILLSDDIRMASGVATMSKAFVLGTCHRFNYFNVGAAIKNPDTGKILDISADVIKRTGVPDANVKILPWDGYGTPDLIRQLISKEQPSAILHFTDPKYWRWLYGMEHEIRQSVPILFYTIWDNVGSPDNGSSSSKNAYSLDPLYNRDYYESCDGLFCISKQTYGMVSRLTSLTTERTWKPHADWQVRYVPHGIDETIYKPSNVPSEFRKRILGESKYDFVLFWSNRNIRRKQPSDVIYSYKLFCDSIGKQTAKRTCLLMHTKPIDENGTDLYEVVNRLNPLGNVIFSKSKLKQEELNYLYNLSDCTINIAGNEGFGLTTAESVMAGVPIIVNVTGGLQDQCGFKLDGKYLEADDYIDIGTVHDWRKWEDVLVSGVWVWPVWSRIRTINGSVPTPYIWDDKVDIVEVSETILDVYNTPKTERKKRGLEGRNAFIRELGLSAANMSEQMTHGIENVLKNWKPKPSYELFKF
jgi:glycosyltransferase involved in cell wall biosynthesis